MKLILGTICLWLVIQQSAALYPSSSDVVDLTPANFDRLVLQGDAVWVVEFYAPWCGHCKSLVPEYQKAATALKGFAKVGAVNADEHKGLAGQFGVRGFPTLKIFGANKKSPSDYNGQRTAEGIADAVLAEAKKMVKANLGKKPGSGSGGGDSDSKSDDVIELTDANFDKLVLNSDDVWLVEFFAPWCGHCKNLAPQWAKAASELKGKVKLGALDATVHQQKAQEYGVQGYPTIKFFPGGKKDRHSVSDYDGGRTSSDIVTWALDKYVENVPTPEVHELLSQDVLTEACEGKALCIVSVLPHILDCNSKCRNNFVNVLKEMAEKYKAKQWGYVWTEALSQSKLEETLGMGGFGYPAMAVVNLKKKKYSLLRGSFSKEGINEFLRDISYGRGQTAPIPGDGDIKVVTVEAWDGKDGQLPEEEDIDLSDVVLDDEKDEL
ncbi:protein disulfide-isomerase A6 homolog [Phlebotomus argentipes]|uniref:protein disulfide-isomerase A6 homolog n=1 Tax=Phlebotomus argentipes TaxID=94469 RepID=UPI00289378B2|nr:protein disulfide-isomerase A6 homolog [Phlebotomus argentipes]